MQKLRQRTDDSNTASQLETQPCLWQEITFLQVFLNSHGTQAQAKGMALLLVNLSHYQKFSSRVRVSFGSRLVAQLQLSLNGAQAEEPDLL